MAKKNLILNIASVFSGIAILSSIIFIVFAIVFLDTVQDLIIANKGHDWFNFRKKFLFALGIIIISCYSIAKILFRIHQSRKSDEVSGGGYDIPFIIGGSDDFSSCGCGT